MDAGIDAPLAFQKYQRQQKGVLQRESKNGWCSSKWPLEYFVVASDFLVSYASQTSGNILQCISLATVTGVASRAKPRDPFLFSVQYATHLGRAPGDESTELFLRASDEGEVHRWIVAINEAVECRRRHQLFMPLREAQDCVSDVQRRLESASQRAADLEAEVQELRERYGILEAESARAIEEKEAVIQSQLEKIDELQRRLEESCEFHSDTRNTAALSRIEEVPNELQTHEMAAILAKTVSDEFSELRRQLKDENIATQDADTSTMVSKDVDELRREVEELREKLRDALENKADGSSLIVSKEADELRHEIESLRQKLCAGSISISESRTNTLSKAGAFLFMSVILRQRRNMLHSGWSALCRQRMNCKVEMVQDNGACLKAAGAACLLTKLSSLRTRLKSAAISSWQVKMARSCAKNARIEAGVVRSEWVCRHSTERSLAACFAKLRPPTSPVAPLQHLSSLHRSLVSHRLCTSFYLWRLRASIPPPSLDDKFSVQTQTEGRHFLEYFVNIGIQTGSPSPLDATLLSHIANTGDDVAQIHNDKLARSPSDASSLLSIHSQNGNDVHRSANDFFNESVVEVLNFSQVETGDTMFPSQRVHASPSSAKGSSLSGCSESMTDSSEDEARVFEQRWWHALADVATGDGCTGSSPDDLCSGSNYDSSGGSANPTVAYDALTAMSEMPRHDLPRLAKRQLPPPAAPLGQPPTLGVRIDGRNGWHTYSAQLPVPVAPMGPAGYPSTSKNLNGSFQFASSSPMRTLPPPPFRR